MDCGCYECYESRRCTDDASNIFTKTYFLCLFYLQASQYIILSALVKRCFLTTHIAPGSNALKNERTHCCKGLTSFPAEAEAEIAVS